MVDVIPGFFAFTAADRWEPGIGDPTLMGWLTVVAYFVASALCWANFIRNRNVRFERLFWAVFGLALLALSVNKQLDLQTWFTLTAKSFAKQTGWYEERRIVQALFVFMIAIAGTALLAVAWAVARRASWAHRTAIVGGVFLLCFVIVRAASFHHFDQVLGWHAGQLRMNHVFELGGIGCVAVGAIRNFRGRRKSLGPVGPEQFQWPSCEVR